MSDFNAKTELKNIPGIGQYLPVAARKQWFVHDNERFFVELTLIYIDPALGYACWKARVTNAAGNYAEDTGSATRDVLYEKVMAQSRPNTPKDKHEREAREISADFAERAATSAIGRALVGLGYGTDDALDLDLEMPVDRAAKGREAPTPASARSPRPSAPPSRPAAQPATPSTTAPDPEWNDLAQPHPLPAGGQRTRPATPPQLNAIRRLGTALHLDNATLLQMQQHTNGRAVADLADLYGDEASKLIGLLQQPAA